MELLKVYFFFLRSYRLWYFSNSLLSPKLILYFPLNYFLLWPNSLLFFLLLSPYFYWVPIFVEFLFLLSSCSDWVPIFCNTLVDSFLLIVQFSTFHLLIEFLSPRCGASRNHFFLLSLKPIFTFLPEVFSPLILF